MPVCSLEIGILTGSALSAAEALRMRKLQENIAALIYIRPKSRLAPYPGYCGTLNSFRGGTLSEQGQLIIKVG